MGLSSQNKKKVFDPVRKSWVAATPEELVRQALIQKMVQKLQFPIQYLLVEQDLRKFPHLDQRKSELPDRRIDIVCLAKDMHPDYPFYPLLLIECKDEPLNQKVFDQVIGYNHFVQAPFIAVANEEEVQMGCWDRSLRQYAFIPFLPQYPELLQRARQ